MADFSNQTVVVTGGTRGIGRAITEAFLGAGAEVFALYAGNDEAANAFVASTGNDKLHVAKVDVSDYNAVEAFFGGLESPPQVVVNNAGIRRDQIVGMMPAEDWRRVIQVNLDGTFHVSKFAVMAMSRQRYGRIVNIVSPSGHLGFAGQASYAASKAGQVGMARSLAKEVAKRKITVNCVSPGFVDTELLADLSEEQKQAYRDMVPMKRFGTGEEIAAAVLFLASKEASYISGATLEVTGGL
ncbi:MAG: 3-oxoacyl-ACP reductase FabG [Deltaproteobacteria bacterium]|jgi:3-oxoacyl-[acyl-carrier protein] reductase